MFHHIFYTIQSRLTLNFNFNNNNNNNKKYRTCSRRLLLLRDSGRLEVKPQVHKQVHAHLWRRVKVGQLRHAGELVTVRPKS